MIASTIQNSRPNGKPLRRDRATPAAARGGNVWHAHAALVGDALNQRGRAGQQPRAVLLLAEIRPDDVADFTGEAVRDDVFEAVADLEAQRAILDRDDNQQPVVLVFVADPAAAVFEHLDGVFVDAAVRLERRHRGDDDGVAARLAQRADAPVELASARRVDDVREVVDGVGERRRGRLRRRRQGGERRQ